MRAFLDVVREIRNTRGEYKVDPGRRIRAVAHTNPATTSLAENAHILQRLCNVAELVLIPPDQAPPPNAASIVVGDVSLYLPLEGMLDLDAECKRLADEGAKVRQQLSRTAAMLSNEKFVERAQPAVVQRERDRLADLEAALAQIQDRTASLCE